MWWEFLFFFFFVVTLSRVPAFISDLTASGNFLTPRGNKLPVVYVLCHSKDKKKLSLSFL